MTQDFCKDCGKPFVSDRPGSVTSYFFQYNYCQCKKNEPRNKLSQNKPSQSGLDSTICANCGKSRPTNRRAGSFTSFLFKELRCSCAGVAMPKAAVSASSTSNTSNTSNIVRTSTGDRVAQRKQFTESVRNRRLTASNSKSQIILSSGDIVGNTFRIISLVGMGGMGVVYLAEHTALHRQFALKVLALELVNEQNWLRFQAEAKTLASLNHQTFVKVYDLGIDARSMPFYSMDYLQGYSLEERLMVNGPLSLEEAISVFLEVIDGLAYAHRNGIVHRDIKPGNIMICTIDGAKIVKVLDFGISKLVGADARKLQSLTAVGEIFGSPFYMSPEQCMGSIVDARSDIYSIGCTLFEVLTGFVPFEARTALEIMTMHEEQEPPSLLDVLPGSQFPPSIDLVIKKCLAKLPQDRYQSAKELAIDLERVQEGKDVRAYSTAFPEKIQAIERPTNQVARKPEQDRSIGEGSSFQRNILISWFLGVFAIAVLASAYWFVVHRNIDNHNYFVINYKIPSLAEATSVAGMALTEGELSAYRRNLQQRKYDKAEAIINRAASDPTPSSLGADHSALFLLDDAKNQTWSDKPFGHSIQLATGQKVTVFDFPKNVSMGTIYSLGRQHETDARGEVTITEYELIGFRPSKDFLSHSEWFKKFTADQIGDLDLSNQYTLNDKDIANIKHLINLRKLNLRESNVTSHGITYLNGMKQLTELNVTNCDIDDQALAKLPALRHLEVLEAKELDHLTSTLKAIAGSTKLLRLTLSSSFIDNSALKLIGEDRNIVFLSLSNNSKITASGIKYLAPLKYLYYLNIENCQVGAEAIETLASFKQLHELKITSTQWSQNEINTLRSLLPRNCRLSLGARMRSTKENKEDFDHLESSRSIGP